MIARRMLTFFVLLLVVTALSAGVLAPPRPPVRTTGPPPAPTATSSPVIARTIDAGRARPRTVTIHSGDLLSLTVRADSDDAVVLEGLGALRPVAPEAPVTFDVLGDAPGAYPVVLVGAGRTVGTVRVLTRRR
jgi:hypothetical protein